MHVNYIFLRGALLALVVSAAPRARADVATECIAAADQGQSARDDGRYHAARASFATCARAVCPKPVAASCTKWSRALDDAMPTVVLGAKDANGQDVTQARVTEGSAVLATSLDGKPIEIDPGTHKLRFEHEGSEPVDETVVIRAGEKLRAVDVAFKPVVAETAAPPKREEKSSGNGAKIATAGVLGVLALGGLATGIAMGFASQGDESTAQSIRGGMPASACVGAAGASASCQSLSSAVDAQNRDAAISVAMYVAAGVFAAVAVVAWVAWPKSKADDAEKPALSVIVGPAFAGLRGSF